MSRLFTLINTRFYSSASTTLSSPNRAVHPYHLVDGSPWPLLMSLALLGFAVTVVSWLTGFSIGYLGFSPIILIALISVLWWRDVIREAAGGYHTTTVQRGLLIGFLLFLLSEIMLFFSFFWGFLHSSLSPGIEIGAAWPPVGIHAIDPWSLPLLGTCILLASGFTVTAAHHAIVAGNKYSAILSLTFTVILGALFVFLQANEYYYSGFTISDSVFGSAFYMLTGLHGLHVIAGTLFLLVGLIRLYRDSFSSEHHLGVEFSILYWHLVDIVWLFVFLLVYWWSSN